MIFSPRSTFPRWLLASSNTNNSSKISAPVITHSPLLAVLDGVCRHFLRIEEGIHILERGCNDLSVGQLLRLEAWFELLRRVQHDFNKRRPWLFQSRLNSGHVCRAINPHAGNSVGTANLDEVGK